jgi:hypothetical protein
MAAPFAALETRLNAAVVAHLANAEADFGGGVVVAGEFSNGYAAALGVAGTNPGFLGQSTDLAAVTRGSTVTISGTTYTVVAIEPDGTGMTRLDLEKA